VQRKLLVSAQYFLILHEEEIDNSQVLVYFVLAFQYFCVARCNDENIWCNSSILCFISCPLVCQVLLLFLLFLIDWVNSFVARAYAFILGNGCAY